MRIFEEAIRPLEMPSGHSKGQATISQNRSTANDHQNTLLTSGAFFRRTVREAHSDGAVILRVVSSGEGGGGVGKRRRGRALRLGLRRLVLRTQKTSRQGIQQQTSTGHRNRAANSKGSKDKGGRVVTCAKDRTHSSSWQQARRKLIALPVSSTYRHRWF